MFRTLIGLTLLAANGTVFAQAEDISLALKMYSSERARAVGDLITVIIDEETSSSKSESMGNSKSSKAGAKAATLGDPTGKTLSRVLSKIDIPAYSFDGSSDFSGKGASDSSEKFSAQFTARVVDVLPNGTLLIRGDRDIKLRSESVNMAITGLVRQRDVTTSNTVLSSQVADAHIVYKTGGDASRGSRPGWFTRIFQFVNPF